MGYTHQMLHEVVGKLNTIIERQDKIMAQIDDLKTQVEALKTSIANLATDMQSAFTDLQAEVAAGGSGPSLAGPIADIGAVNLALQKMDAAAQAADPANSPVISSTSLTATGKVGTAFSFQIAASKNPTSFDAVGLPVGLVVDAKTGIISGTPTVAAISVITLKATNASGTGVATLTLTVS